MLLIILSGRHHLQDLGVEEMGHALNVPTDCVICKFSTGSKKGGEFPDRVSDCHLHKDCAPYV